MPDSTPLVPYHSQLSIDSRRSMEGLRRARALGKHLGRRKALTPREAVELRARHQAGWTLKAPMGAYGLSQASVCRYLAQARLVDTEAADEPRGEATLEAPGVYSY